MSRLRSPVEHTRQEETDVCAGQTRKQEDKGTTWACRLIGEPRVALYRTYRAKSEPARWNFKQRKGIDKHLKIRYMETMNTYRAITKKDGNWWIGWIEEVPGVNCQESTQQELLRSLKIALSEALEFNRQDAIAAAVSDYSEELVTV